MFGLRQGGAGAAGFPCQERVSEPAGGSADDLHANRNALDGVGNDGP
jgi:hypothetical protein